MVSMKLDKNSLKKITKKLKAMPPKLQRKAIRSSIDPEAKKIKNVFKAITPVGKRKHKNKYSKAGKIGKGFLKRSFSVRNSGRGKVAGRRIVTRGIGYYLFMSPNETGHKAIKGAGAVQGAKKYSRYWNARKRKVVSSLTRTLSNEIKRV